MHALLQVRYTYAAYNHNMHAYLNVLSRLVLAVCKNLACFSLDEPARPSLACLSLACPIACGCLKAPDIIESGKLGSLSTTEKNTHTHMCSPVLWEVCSCGMCEQDPNLLGHPLYFGDLQGLNPQTLGQRS